MRGRWGSRAGEKVGVAGEENKRMSNQTVIRKKETEEGGRQREQRIRECADSIMSFSILRGSNTKTK